MDLLLDLFTTLPFTVSRNLRTISSDFELLTKLETLLITCLFHSVELLLGKMADGFELRLF